MRIAIAGSTGLIGTALSSALAADGHDVRRLVRHTARDEHEIAWDPARGEIDRGALEGIEAVVNLAGESISQRWTHGAKQRIKQSRVQGTEVLARALASLRPRPSVFVSASAIGIYGDRGYQPLDEASAPGSDFLASVCLAWEAATAPAADADIRVVHSRTGMVLARDGGALPRLVAPFRFGVGGRLGSGRQWVSWIALADVVGAIQCALANAQIRGALNVVSPTPVRNAAFAQALGNELHRPAALPAPAFAMKLLLGEMAEGMVLASQRVAPTRLLTAGYPFALPTLEQALAAIL